MQQLLYINIYNFLGQVSQNKKLAIGWQQLQREDTKLWIKSVLSTPRHTDFSSRCGDFYDPWYRVAEPLPKFLAMPPLRNINLSFEDVCDRVAQELIDRVNESDRTLLLLWSGGIDSTVILVSLLKQNIDRSRLRILLTKESREEHPRFFENYINEKLNWQDTLEFTRGQHTRENFYTVSGVLGDQLFGGGSAGIFRNRYPGESRPWRTCRSEICEILVPDSPKAAAWFLAELERNIESQPRDIVTTDDFFWWFNFNFKWRETAIRSSYNIDLWGDNRHCNPDCLKNYLKNNVTFFGHELFQLWSLATENKNIDKQQCRDYIYSWDGDRDYRDNKKKERSTPKIAQPDPRPTVIFEDQTAVWQLSDNEILSLLG